MTEPSRYAMQIAEKITRFDINEDHDRVALLANPLKEIALKIDDLLNEQVEACAKAIRDDISGVYLVFCDWVIDKAEDAIRNARLGKK